MGQLYPKIGLDSQDASPLFRMDKPELIALALSQQQAVMTVTMQLAELRRRTSFKYIPTRRQLAAWSAVWSCGVVAFVLGHKLFM